jgi:uncharacterized protein (TIGR02001 family)
VAGSALIRRVGSLRTTPACGLRVLCVAAWLYGTPAHAQAEPLRWGGSLSLSSNYVYRGLSQTDGRPSVQGGLYVRSESGWSAALWASTVNRGPGPGADSEIDVQLSKAWSLDEQWSLQLSANHYFYPDDNRARPYEYDELVVSLSFQNRLTATVAYSPNTSRFSRDVFARHRTARSYEATFLQPLSLSWSLYGGVGHYDLTDLFDAGYWYWSAGVSYCVGQLQMDLSHIDTDHTARRLFDYEVGKRRWIAALSWRF